MVDANMPVRIFVAIFLFAVSAPAQNLHVRPLELLKDVGSQQPDPVKQLMAASISTGRITPVSLLAH